MKKALLTALALGLSVAGFAQESAQPKQEKPQAPEVKQQKEMPPHGKGMHRRGPGMHQGKGMHRRGPGMMGGNRSEMTAKIEFPQEWEAIEKQRKELLAKAREKMKEYREAVKKYRESKDEASLKIIKESLGKRYDYFVNQYKEITEKASKDEKAGPMAERLKARMEPMIAEGKDKWIEKQIQRILTPRKRGPRKEGKAPAPAQAPADEKK